METVTGRPTLIYGTVTHTGDYGYTLYGGKTVHCVQQYMPKIGDTVKLWKTNAGLFHVSLHKDLVMMSETQAWCPKKIPLKDWWIVRVAGWIGAIGTLAAALWSVS